uniref:C2H2-type domain-containing protein n=2 Tax=Plectus sambesii TaxID=2011161 RepID=A0A914WAA1_9BILA
MSTSNTDEELGQVLDEEEDIIEQEGEPAKSHLFHDKVNVAQVRNASSDQAGAMGVIEGARSSGSAAVESTSDANLLPPTLMPIQGETEPPPKDSEPEPGHGARPLTHLTIMVGAKKLRLKLVPAPPKPPPKILRPTKLSMSASMINEDSDDESPGLGEMSGSMFNENPFACAFCGKNYSSRIKLLRHETEHTGQKPFTCNYCGKGFTHKQSLIMHERIHTGEKPFQCPICTKCFARQTNYNIHMKLHASGRRYFCSFCGKWYRTEHEMLDHQQMCLAQMHGQAVATERPLRYQCSYCEKMFHHRRDKNIHERTHTGERPYTCGYCGKGFTQSQALTIHIRTHTGERPYTCAVCGKDFRDSSALRKHEFVKHTNLRNVVGFGMSSSDNMAPILIPGDQLEAAVLAIHQDD